MQEIKQEKPQASIKKTKISYTALRFDIITVTAGVIQHYENAFTVTNLTL